jgi:O-antigen/teichoic acid export membrane protein
MTRPNAKVIGQTFLTNLAIQGCNVMTGVITARLLLPVGRGELATIMLWPTILAGLGIMGVNFALARAAAAGPDKENDLARAAVALGLLLAGAGMLAGYFLLPWLLPADKQHLLGLNRIYLLWLPLNFVALNLIALDHGRMRWRRYNLIRLSVVLPYLGFILVFWLRGVDALAWFVAALLCSNLFTMLLRLAVQWRGIIRGRVRVALAVSVLKGGFPFFLASLSTIAVMQMDKALVVSLLPTEMVGYYAAAFTFAAAHGSLGGALGVTSFAALANEADTARQGQYLAQVFRQATLLYIGAGAGVALLAPLLIVPLFGADFAPAVQPAAILALATSLLALGNILNEGLKGRGSAAPGILAQFLGGGLIGLAAWLLVPRHGLAGLAWAAVLGAGGQLAFLVLATSSLLHLNLFSFWGLRRAEVKALCGRVTALLPF